MNKVETCEQPFSRMLATPDIIVDGALLKLEERELRTITLYGNITSPSI